jgi:hypothetical protein
VLTVGSGVGDSRTVRVGEPRTCGSHLSRGTVKEGRDVGHHGHPGKLQVGVGVGVGVGDTITVLVGEPRTCGSRFSTGTEGTLVDTMANQDSSRVELETQ